MCTFDESPPGIEYNGAPCPVKRRALWVIVFSCTVGYNRLTQRFTEGGSAMAFAQHKTQEIDPAKYTDGKHFADGELKIVDCDAYLD